MNNPFKLSVVVLVYNTEEYLRECLDSLVNQTLDGLEIIVVNDESPDNSLEIIEEYRTKFHNIKLINQKNSGGAVAGNNGFKIASGEYITIMDSDDVVPLDAYEKLYSKAKEENADIVIGKPNLLINGMEREILYKREKDVWEKSRVINNLLDFPDVFYDGYYWNKIYKRNFFIDNECFMPPGMLYADRPMVHKAFLHAKKIVIITDIVYLWRKREETSKIKSITQLKTDLKNFKDRIESIEYQIHYFNEFGNKLLTTEFLKRNVDRLFFPIKGILDSEEFKETYLRETKRILNLVEDVYNNDLGITKNLYIYMILNDLTEELEYYLRKNPNGEIIYENGEHYWALPFFRDKNVQIPDDLFKITTLLPQFILIDGIRISSDFIYIDKLSTVEKFKVSSAILQFQSRTKIDKKHSCELTKNKDNSFSGTFPLKEISPSDIYDVYLILNYDEKEYKFRITRKNLPDFPDEKILKTLKEFILYFTNKGNLSLVGTHLDIVSFEINHNGIFINTKESKNNVKFFIRQRITKEKVLFQQEQDSSFKLYWKHFLDKNATYDLYYQTPAKTFKINCRHFRKLKPKFLKVNNNYLSFHLTDNGDFSLISDNYFNHLIRKVRLRR